MSYDVAVIGAGAAGLMAAATLSEIHDPARVVLCSDRAVGRGNSVMAQGGLQIPSSAQDRDLMLDDMERSAGDSFDRKLASRFVANIGGCVETLERWGLELERDVEGRYIRRSAGGTSSPRVVCTPGPLGASLIKLLKSRLGEVHQRPHRSIASIELDTRKPNPRFRLTDAEGVSLVARTVIVASGGASYEHATTTGERTTNQLNSNDSIRSALRNLGLCYVGSQRWQSHPFGLVDITESHVDLALPEPIVGMGVRLEDRLGDEVAPIESGRRVLSEQIRRAIDEDRWVSGPAGRPGVGLVMTDSAWDFISGFGHIQRSLRSAGLWGSGVLVVRPFLHYELGGFAFSQDGSSKISGMFLAGEVSGGLHGDNRLMGNGISDSLVHGWLAAHAASVHAGRSATSASASISSHHWTSA